MDERTLLEGIRADDPAAFDEFVRTFGDRIYGFGVRMCGEREDAKDVLQDTLLQAYRALKDLEHPEAMRSWVFTVAANACRMRRRRGKYEPEREVSLEELTPRGGVAPTEIPDVRSLPDEAVLRDEVRDRVRAAIDALPEHYRMILVLRDIEHFTAPEVSKMLDLPISTIKMRLHRARLMLRDRLEGAFAGGAA